MEKSVLLTFASGLIAALILGYLAKRLLKLSPIVGYLLAGIAVGPFTPGVVANHSIAEQFADIGVILMMFGVGLRFHIKELLAVWKTAVPGALSKCLVSTLFVGTCFHFVAGLTWSQSFVLGVAIAPASTVVSALVLGDSHELHSPIGHLAMGWVVVEDLTSVAVLLMLPLLASSGASSSIGREFALAGAKVVGLFIVVILLARYVIPWILERIAKTRLSELFTLAILSLALGIAALSSGVFGVDMALGAFLGGLAVGRSEFSMRAALDAIAMRDVFSVLFFVSVGMLFDPTKLFSAPLILILVMLAVFVLLPIWVTIWVRISGKPWSFGMQLGSVFAQIGEFSFIVGTIARSLDLMTIESWNALCAVSILSIALNPLYYRFTRKLGKRKLELTPSTVNASPRYSILLGYGPVGQIVFKLLRERGVEVAVIDLNLNTVRNLKAQGIKAFYGDVLRPGTLEAAGIAQAGSLILSAAVDDAAEICRAAQSLNPNLKVLVRCTHLRDVEPIKRGGANVVAAGEAEVGVALAEAVLDYIPQGEADSSAILAYHKAIRERLYNPNAPIPTAPPFSVNHQPSSENHPA